LGRLKLFLNFQLDRAHFLSLDLPLESGARTPVFVFDNVLMAPIALPE
jgi:hypothetical protein